MDRSERRQIPSNGPYLLNRKAHGDIYTSLRWEKNLMLGPRNAEKNAYSTTTKRGTTLGSSANLGFLPNALGSRRLQPHSDSILYQRVASQSFVSTAVATIIRHHFAKNWCKNTPSAHQNKMAKKTILELPVGTPGKVHRHLVCTFGVIVISCFRPLHKQQHE